MVLRVSENFRQKVVDCFKMEMFGAFVINNSNAFDPLFRLRIHILCATNRVWLINFLLHKLDSGKQLKLD
jgi:hypothetical protein